MRRHSRTSCVAVPAGERCCCVRPRRAAALRILLQRAAAFLLAAALQLERYIPYRCESYEAHGFAAVRFREWPALYARAVAAQQYWNAQTAVSADAC
ncbi:hypothetical protein JKP88DRAFT_346661 [Tribonema minus]|uniref:Uncharacterized protein n=1 Tax=Tribonema minus TaxID=303371 RepID=A0A835YV48_9STRA|nr:hypothetical protein JKP88DRAFT_346661 [Tribonema minus]